MKFNDIIIGGGLSGLFCGIQLAEQGHEVLILSAGQSTLHFNSGSIDLLGYGSDGEIVADPLHAIADLPDTHPYARIGADRLERLTNQAKEIFRASGLDMQGDAHRNHYRFTPLGILKPTWLTLRNYATATDTAVCPYRKVILVNVLGYLDFPVEFIQKELQDRGAEVQVVNITTPTFQRRRHSPSEMRSVNLAKALSNHDSLSEFVQALRKLPVGDMIYAPAIVGMDAEDITQKICDLIGRPISFITTLPPSVPGMRIQALLRRYFTQLGGTYILGSTVQRGTLLGDVVTDLTATNLPDEHLAADQYILATGSFQSEGIRANYQRVYEPILNLDVDADTERVNWTDPNVFASQPYMSFGVHTDASFHAMRGGTTLRNVFAAGQVLSGNHPVRQASRTGVSILTGLAVADTILKS